MFLLNDKRFNLNYRDFYNINEVSLNSAFSALPKDLLARGGPGPTYLFLQKEPKKEVECFVYSGGSKLKDIINVGMGVLLASESVFDVLEKHKFTGWSRYPLELFGKHGEKITGYSGLTISGKCGPTYSEVKLIPNLSGLLSSKYVGLYFDPVRWDNSDIFSFDNSLFIIIRREVKEALEKARIAINNFSFEKLTYFTMSPSGGEHKLEVSREEEKQILETQYAITDPWEYAEFYRKFLSNPKNRRKNEIEILNEWLLLKGKAALILNHLCSDDI